MSLCGDVDGDERALAGEVEDLRREVDAVRGTQEEEDRRADAVGVDLQLDFVVGGVVALVGDDFEIVEAEVAAVEAFADDREEVAAFDGVAGCVGHGVGEAILAFFGGFHLELGEAVGARWRGPSCGLRFRWACRDGLCRR